MSSACSSRVPLELPAADIIINELSFYFYSTGAPNMFNSSGEEQQSLKSKYIDPAQKYHRKNVKKYLDNLSIKKNIF